MLSLGKLVCQKCSGNLIKEELYARCIKCGIYWIIVYNPDGTFKYMKKVEHSAPLVKEYIGSLNDPKAFEAVNLGTLKRTRENDKPKALKFLHGLTPYDKKKEKQMRKFKRKLEKQLER